MNGPDHLRHLLVEFSPQRRARRLDGFRQFQRQREREQPDRLARLHGQPSAAEQFLVVDLDLIEPQCDQLPLVAPLIEHGRFRATNGLSRTMSLSWLRPMRTRCPRSSTAQRVLSRMLLYQICIGIVPAGRIRNLVPRLPAQYSTMAWMPPWLRSRAALASTRRRASSLSC